MTEVDDQALAAKVTRLVRKGILDDHLVGLGEVIYERRKFILARQAYDMVMEVGVGDVIKIRPEVKPRYLEGQLCTVVDLSPKRRSGVPLVRAEFHRGPVGRFRNGIILLPGSAFTLVQKAEIIRHVEADEDGPAVTLVQ